MMGGESNLIVTYFPYLLLYRLRSRTFIFWSIASSIEATNSSFTLPYQIFTIVTPNLGATRYNALTSCLGCACFRWGLIPFPPVFQILFGLRSEREARSSKRCRFGNTLAYSPISTEAGVCLKKDAYPTVLE